MVNKPCCIDIYQGDDVNDHPTPLAGLDQVRATGVFGCIHKATEGPSYRDSRYDARRTKWMSGQPISVTDVDGAKLSLAPVWGAYHFFHGIDPAGEARNFLMTSRLNSTDMAFLDWEAVGASGFQPSLEAADAFCQAVEAALGRPCGVYGGNVPRERFDAERASEAVLERFAARPFWFCAYGGYSEEKLDALIPTPWKKAKSIWLWQDDGDQYGPGPHSMPGIARYCDNSTVVGDMTFARLHAEWLGKPLAKPAPEPVVVVDKPKPVETPAKPDDGKLSRMEKLKEEMEHLAEEIEDEVKRDA
jgi:GH25 family lysozyme M1 (1,4-beta-N-acetylmuramidase)